jgi:hypothetical protein
LIDDKARIDLNNSGTLSLILIFLVPFMSSIEGTLTKNWQWPVKQFLSILDMNGTKKIKINDQGAAVIEVDSGLIIYQFFLPAYSK